MDLHYERRGLRDAPALVLIHGIAHRWQAWEPVIDLLAAHHDVIAIDLPGFGRSPVPPGGVARSVPETAEALAAFFAGLGLSQPHVAGNSLGGALALELAAAGYAASATALSPAGFTTSIEAGYAIATLTQHRAGTFAPKRLLRRVARSGGGRAMSFGMIVARPRDLSPERAYGDALAMRGGKGYLGTVRALTGYRFTGAPSVPVTVAWGDRDRILLPRQAARAAAVLPQARHLPLPGCGHVPMSDNPHLVAQTILATTEPRPPRRS